MQESNVLPKTHMTTKPSLSPSEPVLLDADQLDYEKEGEVVVATGHVEISQGTSIMLADQVIYDKSTGQVTAHGNISMLETSGNVYFADDMELQDDMKMGVIQQFKTRLFDNSVMTAATAKRINEDVTTMTKVTYSPCLIKCTNPGTDPIWQIRAKRATMDRAEQDVSYDDANFEIFGVPLVYMPYFSHALPGSPNESGLLKPTYQHSTSLGTVLRQPVYYSISPDKDVTLTPIYVGKESPVMAGEYRQAYDTGLMRFDGSLTDPRSRDDLGRVIAGHDSRWHINGEGDFKVNPDRDFGFDIHRTSDDTYLRRYGFAGDTLLTSRAYLEDYKFLGGNDRTYNSLQAVSFQGLTTADKGTRIPFALPMADFNYESDAGKYDSRFTVDSNALILHRQTGDDSKRISNTLGWKLPYITEGGQVFQLNTQVRNDIYSVNNVALDNGRDFSGVTGRTIPQADVLWHYPFINHFAGSSIMVEPVIDAAVSPGGGNPEKIPNEDSLVPEFTDSNLFTPNRFAGYDRVESGPRVSYGVRGQAQVLGDKYIDMLLGQNYRMNNDPNFPFSNDLYSHVSDYVGKVGITSKQVTMAYRFRLDKDTLAAKRNEVDLGIILKPVSLNLAYLSLDKDPVLATKEEIAGAVVIDLTDEWSLTASGREDLELDQISSAYGGVTYKNECISVSTVLGREYIQDRDVQSSTNFLIKLSFKNLD